jgi:hypothetical protein
MGSIEKNLKEAIMATISSPIEIDTVFDTVITRLFARITAFNQYQIDADTLEDAVDDLMDDITGSPIPDDLELPLFRAFCHFDTRLHLNLTACHRSQPGQLETNALLVEFEQQRAWAHKEAAKQGGAQ